MAEHELPNDGHPKQNGGPQNVLQPNGKKTTQVFTLSLPWLRQHAIGESNGPHAKHHRDQQPFEPFDRKFGPCPPAEGEGRTHPRNHEQRSKASLMHPMQKETHGVHGFCRVAVPIILYRG